MRAVACQPVSSHQPTQAWGLSRADRWLAVRRAGPFDVTRPAHFPMQNRPKISPSKSSAENAPVILSSAR